MTQRKVLLQDAGHQVFDELTDDDLATPPGGGAVDSVNGQTGVVVLDAGDVGADASGAAAAAQAASQPLDSDLTAIAALTTTSYGRALLALADAAAGRTALGLGTAAVAASGDFQPIDSDLTAIAALTTTSFGRALLALADAAALRGAAGLGTLATQSGTFSGTSSGTNTGDQTLPTRASLGLDTTDSPQFAGVNVGAATDTTITRTGAGDIAVEGNAIYRAAGTDVAVTDGGTGASTASAARANLGIFLDVVGPAAVGTQAFGVATVAARRDHVHASGAGTPSTQAFGDTAATGSGPAAAMTDHKHAMPDLPAIDATGPATDITTRNVSTSAHGLAPKLPNDATKFLDGTGAYAVPPGTGLTNPMTTPADLIVGGTSGAPARLAKGADGTVLTVDPTTHLLVWAASAGGAPSGAAGGGLAGTYPNPTVATNANLTGDVTSSGNATTLATVPVAKGGTGSVTALAARAALGVGPGYVVAQKQSLLAGVLSESIPRYQINAQTALATTGRLSGVLMHVRAGVACTNMSWVSGSTALGTPTNWWFALVDESYNLIRQTTDQLATAWAASALATLALDSVPTTAGARVASTTVTLTIPTLSEALSVLFTAGDSVVVSNASIAAYNGTFTVASVTATTITYVSGGSATDSLSAPFPTIRMAAGKRVYTPAADAGLSAIIMMKMTTAPTLGCFTGLTQTVFTVAAPNLAFHGDTGLTGTCPSPVAHATSAFSVPWVAIT